MVSVSILLKRAKALIPDANHLCRYSYAKDKDNKVVQWDSKQAVKFCMHSAIFRACMGYPSALERQVEETLAKSLRMTVNDLTAFSETHSYEEIMQAYDDAIVMAYANQDGVEEDDIPPVVQFEAEPVSEDEPVDEVKPAEPEKKKRGRPKKVIVEEEPTLIGPLVQFFS